MDNDQHAYHLRKLVEELTTSGKDKLDEEAMKKIKKICKRSDIYVIELYRLVNKQMKKKHAEIRFSSFLICNEIFCRSHCFRELLLKDFLSFVDLVLGLDPEKPLPKPEAVARKLKQKCVETLQCWYDHYGDGYSTLRRGYIYLRDCKKVDFAELTARTEAERQRAEDERLRAEELKRKKIEKVNSELEEDLPEIKDCFLQFQNCFKLLIPDVHDFFIPIDDSECVSQEGGFMPDSDSTTEGSFTQEGGGFIQEETAEGNEDEEYGSEFMRGHGIMKGINIQINMEDVRKLQETADNEVVVENLKEHIHIFNTKHLPQVRKWEQTMQPYSEGNGRLIKRIVDLKQLIQGAVKKFESLHILPQKKPRVIINDDLDSDDDDDFVEVPFNDPRVVRAAESEAALLGMTSSRNSPSLQPDDPNNLPSTSGGSQISNHSHKMEGNVKQGTKQKSIRCPDEYLSQIGSAPKRLHNPLAGLSQVWTATPDLHEQDEINSTGGVMGVATQRVNYERTWEPVKWACRAPLATGSLCPRRDRDKCPFHGSIIPRDDSGAPLLPEDAAKEKAAREKYERDNPAWADPQLLADLKAATGVDLKITRGRGKRKRKYENLTDLKKTTPRERLMNKVMSRKAVRRLNAALAREHTSAPNTSDFNFSRS